MIEPFYQDETFTLYCGDCREIIPQLDLSGVFLTLTDPPYGINSVRTDGKMGGSVAAPNKHYIPVAGDDAPMSVDHLLTLPGRKIIWGADHLPAGTPPGGRLLVWDKRDGMKSNDFADAEIAWDSAGGPCRLFKHRQVGMLHDGYGDVERFHPNQKPLALMLWCLSFIPDDEEDYLIFDPYAGSGTASRAAKDCGCRSIAIELQREYCPLIVDRMRQESLLGAINGKRSKRGKEQTSLDFPSPPDGDERSGDSSGGLRSAAGVGPVLGGESPARPGGGEDRPPVPGGGEAVGHPQHGRVECPW